ncbi:mRNA cleavage and polyadenylation specificity factor complex subunit [Xylona heveae TC161]|uniref:mRNA cleavage and polyadenylation specificity factor complex subunit n=1 Tax=Xylona heveae (strain CBS 132557 / TC161) TaxID=1328760 RepID=A0A165HPC1_XYLHT|nr:mRNA cleavage and polyadenylation specificity factor complex subunit [Xylona heveae TC161]KZF23799.1 mRNA cleavage and polyadenylation specificity factor complex subunit [Xylona heveae TC161]
MSQPLASVADQLAQLDAARKLVLGDSAFYSQIVQGILPIVGAHARVELRRWGADFLAETFASPGLSLEQKQQLCLLVLQTIKEILELPSEDASVIKSMVQASASIYPLVFRHIIANPDDAPTWEKMAAIKSNILRRWDTAPAGVRVCCIKFVQRVVQVQTPGAPADPRRAEQSETSLTLVPRNHPLIPTTNLEAETFGLLDRMLNVFHENPLDAILVNATLNCLGGLIRSRPSISNKIISTILNFNPLKQASMPLTSKVKVIVKSMERTTRALLLNINKRNPNGPLAGKIHQYMERMAQSRLEFFDDANRKRGPPIEPTDGLDQAKRLRLGAGVPDTPTPTITVPPLPPGPASYAQLFTLTRDEAFRSFDVSQLPIDLVIKIALPVLYRLDQKVLDPAINGLRARYDTYVKQQQRAAPRAAPVDEDDEAYEPDFEPTEDPEQIMNKLDNDVEEPEDTYAPPDVALGQFELPPPPPMSQDETANIGRGTVARVFSMMNMLDESGSAVSKKTKTGINRLAASSYDREAWLTVIIRLATRASTGLDDYDPEANIKTEDGPSTSMTKSTDISLSDSIRDALYLYFIEDFRRRMDIAIAWLNEEWYNERVQKENGNDPQPTYEKWALKIIDGILPYLDAKDKMLIRLLSEMPAVSEAVLERVKKLAGDPERVSLAVNSLHYLILLRPPVRDICIDALEDLWRNYEDARSSAAKLLARWRPQVLQQQQQQQQQQDQVGAVTSASNSATPVPVPVSAPAPAPAPTPAPSSS